MKQSSAKQSGLEFAPLLFVFAFVVLTGGTRAELGETSQVRKTQLASVRKLFGLEYPYSIVRLGMYADGGSLGGLIRDARGTELLFAWDGREPGYSPDTIPEEKPHLCYVGADYPARPGARSLGVGTPEERALVFVLRSFVNSQIPRSLQDSLYAVRFDYSLTSERRRDLGSLVEKQQIALNALRIARYLERQASPGGLKGWPWPKPP